MRRLSIIPLLLAAGLALAGEVRHFDSPEQERIYKELTAELRCTVCQNQNIADSHAELAADLRNKTFHLVQQGKSKAEIKAFMVERYGNFVLYDPPVTPGTLLLWGGPFLFLLFGGWLLLRLIRKRRAAQAGAGVNDEQLRRAAALLRGKEDSDA